MRVLKFISDDYGQTDIVLDAICKDAADCRRIALNDMKNDPQSDMFIETTSDGSFHKTSIFECFEFDVKICYKYIQ